MNTIKALIVLLVLFSVPMNGTASELTFSDRAEELYVFDNVFMGGVMLYRPRGTQGMRVFDLSTATVLVVKFGEPYNCSKIIIKSKTDGTIFGPCVEDSK